MVLKVFSVLVVCKDNDFSEIQNKLQHNALSRSGVGWPAAGCACGYLWKGRRESFRAVWRIGTGSLPEVTPTDRDTTLERSDRQPGSGAGKVNAIDRLWKESRRGLEKEGYGFLYVFRE